MLRQSKGASWTARVGSMGVASRWAFLDYGYGCSRKHASSSNLRLCGVVNLCYDATLKVEDMGRYEGMCIELGHTYGDQ